MAGQHHLRHFQGPGVGYPQAINLFLFQTEPGLKIRDGLTTSVNNHRLLRHGGQGCRQALKEARVVQLVATDL